MNGVTVLSPHRDDAVFSLFDFLSCLTGLGIPATVLNFFTVSSYAPHAANDDPKFVSAIREREDRQALRVISRNLRVIDCGLLDAPLRLHIPLAAVCNQHADEAFSPSLTRQLTAGMRIAKKGLVLAPLGLGNHVDHLAVHHAATGTIRALRLGFYEDLPYATWTSSEVVREKIADDERALGCRLARLEISSKMGTPGKRRAAARYSSQVTATEAATIARWGERVWVPRASPWRQLLRHLP